MSADMYPDAAREYIMHMHDGQSTPNGTIKMFVLTDSGPLFEVYGWESDVAEYAQNFPEENYFWAEANVEDISPELSWDQVESLLSLTAVAVNGPTAAEHSGAHPVSMVHEGAFTIDAGR